MQLTTYPTRISLACAVAIFCFPVALAQSMSLASELVEVARFDFVGIHVLRLTAERDFAAGKGSEDEVRCLRSKADDTFRSTLAAQIAQKMTPEELRTAITFLGASTQSMESCSSTRTTVSRFPGLYQALPRPRCRKSLCSRRLRPVTSSCSSKLLAELLCPLSRKL